MQRQRTVMVTHCALLSLVTCWIEILSWIEALREIEIPRWIEALRGIEILGWNKALRGIETLSGAFWRKTLWKSLNVIAIIVNHVVTLQKSKSPLLPWIQTLCGLIPPGLFRINSTIGISSPFGNTGLYLEVLIRCDEGSLSPVNLDKTTSGSPIISIPNAAEDSHRLLVWKMYA